MTSTVCPVVAVSDTTRPRVSLFTPAVTVVSESPIPGPAVTAPATGSGIATPR